MGLPCAHEIQSCLYQESPFLQLQQVHRHRYFDPSMILPLVVPPLLAQEPARARPRGRPSAAQQRRQPENSTRRDLSHFELPARRGRPGRPIQSQISSIKSITGSHQMDTNDTIVVATTTRTTRARGTWGRGQNGRAENGRAREGRSRSRAVRGGRARASNIRSRADTSSSDLSTVIVSEEERIMLHE